MLSKFAYSFGLQISQKQIIKYKKIKLKNTKNPHSKYKWTALMETNDLLKKKLNAFHHQKVIFLGFLWGPVGSIVQMA